MTDEGDANDPVELEIYEGGSGILRTEYYGWFPVTNFSMSPSLRFVFDNAHEVAPNALDRRIIQRAAAILSSEKVWNRRDNRICPNNANKWSIYCALEKATIEATGGFDHRRPALEVVREIVGDRSAGRNYNHRLMDYNNDPITRFSDVQSLFGEALARTEDVGWLKTHGFKT